MAELRVGDRVRLTVDVDRFPHFIVPAFSFGTVVHADAEVFAVRMDELVPGAEAWENEVHWYPMNGDDPSPYLAREGL